MKSTGIKDFSFSSKNVTPHAAAAAAAFFAVSKFRNVVLGQILFGGDNLSGVEWDSRRWNSREEIKRNLVELSLKTCLQL